MMTLNTPEEQHMEEHTYAQTLDQTIVSTYMSDVIISQKDIKEHLKKTKNKKSAGSDRWQMFLFFIILLESDTAIQNLVQCLNTVLNTDFLPKGWQ